MNTLCKVDDWDTIFSFAVHRMGVVPDINQWREKIENNERKAREVLGSPVQTFELGPDDIAQIESLSKLRQLTNVDTFMKLWTLAGSGIHDGSLDLDRGIPKQLIDGKWGRTKTSTAIAKKIKAMRAGNYPEKLIKELEQQALKLTEAIAIYTNETQQTQGDTFVLRWSRNPADLMRLGYLGVDDQACFAAGSANGAAALAIAQTFGGAVGFIYKKSEPWHLLGRCWGASSSKGLLITNIYPNSNGKNREFIKKLLPAFAHKMGYTGKPETATINADHSTTPHVYGMPNQNNGANLYTNKDAVVFPAKGHRTQTEWVFDCGGLPPGTRNRERPDKKISVFKNQTARQGTYCALGDWVDKRLTDMGRAPAGFHLYRSLLYPYIPSLISNLTDTHKKQTLRHALSIHTRVSCKFAAHHDGLVDMEDGTYAFIHEVEWNEDKQKVVRTKEAEKEIEKVTDLKKKKTKTAA